MNTYLLCYEIERLEPATLASKGHQIIEVERLDADCLKTQYARIVKEVKTEFPDCDFGNMVWISVTQLDS